MANDNSKRRDDIAAGVAEGAVKEGVNKFADPIAESLKESLLEKFGNGEETNPMVEVLAESGSKFLVLLAAAEGFGILADQLGGGADEKVELLSRYIRKMAGQELGEKGVKIIFDSLPAFKSMMSDFDNIRAEDIKYALGEKSEVHNHTLPEMIPESEVDVESKEEEEIVEVSEKTLYRALGLEKE